MIVGDGLEKRYGRKRALKGVSFSVPRAGFLLVTGPNGSGKTTLLRLVAGLAAATKGTLTIDAERGDLGYVAHEPLLYRELTALENLELFGRLYRIPERRERSPGRRIIRRLQLGPLMLDRTGGHAVDPDAVRPELRRRHLGELLDAALGSRVVHQTGKRHLVAGGADIDDRSADAASRKKAERARKANSG